MDGAQEYQKLKFLADTFSVWYVPGGQIHVFIDLNHSSAVLQFQGLARRSARTIGAMLVESEFGHSMLRR